MRALSSLTISIALVWGIQSNATKLSCSDYLSQTSQLNSFNSNKVDPTNVEALNASDSVFKLMHLNGGSFVVRIQKKYENHDVSYEEFASQVVFKLVPNCQTLVRKLAIEEVQELKHRLETDRNGIAGALLYTLEQRQTNLDNSGVLWQSFSRQLQIHITVSICMV